MSYTYLVVRYFGLVSMSFVLLHSSLVQVDNSKVEYVSYASPSHHAWGQLSDYVPPDDIGLPERGEPGGTR